MADKTQINLERIRACDAEWEESKHPRSENGQFASGSGAHVSKIQSGGKAKASSIKAGEIAKNQERYDNAHKSMAANYLSDLTNAVKGGDYETAREKLERHEKDKKRYDQLTAQNSKFKAAKATLEKARPKIAAMRELAKAASNNTVVGEEGKKYLKNKAGWGNGPTVPHVASHMLKEIKAGKTLEEAVSATKEFYTDSAGLSPDVAKALQDLQTGVKLKEAKAPASKPAKSDSAKQSVKSALNKHIKQIKSNFALNPDQAQNLTKDAQDMFKKAENAGALEKAAEFLKRKEKLEAEMQTHDYSGDRYEWYNDLSKEDKSLVSASITGVLKMAIDRTPKPAAASGEKIPGTGHKKYGITRSDLLLT